MTLAGQQGNCQSVALAEFKACCGHVKYLGLTLEGEILAGRADC